MGRSNHQHNRSISSTADFWRSAVPMSGLWRRTLQGLFLAFVTLTLLLVFVRSGKGNTEVLASFRPYPPVNSKERTCAPDLETLRRNKVTQNVEYTRIDIEANPSEALVIEGTTHIEHIPHKLPSNYTISTDSSIFKPKVITPCDPPIKVRVPAIPAKANAAHLVIGAATTVPRLEESLEAWSHWGANTKARIFVLVEPHGDRDKVQQKARKMGFDITLTERTDSFNDRYFALIQHLYQQRDDRTKWAIVIDDDTFFPSMNRLVNRLAEYNHEKLVYLGGTSEDIVQMARWGWMAFGGAGVFLSVPMLAELNKVFPRCYDYKEKNGDQRIAWCVYAHTIVKLVVDPDLHQLDLRGDHSGFYESGRPQPLTVHHWRSWFHHDMVKTAAVSRICGDACLLQRYKFKDGWYLSNGFSIVKYSHDLNPGDISMERTWDNFDGANDASYDHTLAPIRPPDKGKISYRLEDVIVDEDEVRQFYIMRPGKDMNDRVVEVVWRRGATQ